MFQPRLPIWQTIVLAAGCGLFAAPLTAADKSEAGVDRRPVVFNRDIRPILADKCFQCHGPDEAERAADLRFDTKAGALADLGGHKAIVPGDVKQSELVRRISTANSDERMPPAKSGLSLTKGERALLTRWIGEGAEWQNHWSLISPVRPQVPAVTKVNRVRNEIDNFILARLERDGLSLSPPAGRERLIRRVTLDLTGLPPTLAEIDAFLADEDPDAYERVVDRLFESPPYGERMAVEWLDLGRYADTNGYEVDTARQNWRWRDWLVEAFRENMPFDRFTVEQLAGDLLPEATLEQRIATGFNRNHRVNREAGSIPEEFRVEYVVDRVDTTATVWMGLTMGCARCHDHKYDPITQKDFYRFFAFFNNVPEVGRDGVNSKNPVPSIKAPTRAMQAQLAQIDGELNTLKQQDKQGEPQLAKLQLAWEQELIAAERPPEVIQPTAGMIAYLPLDGDLKNTVGESTGGSAEGGAAPFVPGQVGQGADFDGKRTAAFDTVGDFDNTDAFSFGGWINAPENAVGSAISRMNDAAGGHYRGYDLYVQSGTFHAQFVHTWSDNCLTVQSEKVLKPNQWQHLFVTYDGSGKPSGVTIYVDGKAVKGNVRHDSLTKSIRTTVPLRLGGRVASSRLKAKLDEVRVYSRTLTADEVASLARPVPLHQLAALAADKRTPGQSGRLRQHFVANHAPEEYRQRRKRQSELTQRKNQMEAAIPEAMVMQEMAQPRQTHILKRGEYDKPGEAVSAGVPASLPPLPDNFPQNRLGMARWLVDPAHPLTARVTVNRFWQMYFGTGLVRTTEDFGTQGEWPSHPDLLDWLATEFIRSGWDVKRMQKLMVMSAVYRQSSQMTPELLRKDRDNRLLARSPRLRLSAEMIRDQALAASGLLVRKTGGPSVRPYQPPGLWKELTYGGGFSAQVYVQDKGENLYRRSMYTFWKRTIPPPTMSVFDAPARDVCSVRRGRTNTPLQALVLLNETAFVEAARVLAERTLKQESLSPEERLTRMFRSVVARRPQEQELFILKGCLKRATDRFQHDPAAAAKLVSVGESQPDPTMDQAMLAAYTAVANVIFNLDETITRE